MGKKLQMCGTEAEMREVAARICRDYLHGNWKTVSPHELEFSRVSGGLSNFLYLVGLPDHCTTVTKLTSSVNLNSVQNGASDEDTPGELAEKKSPVSLLRQRSLLRSNSFNLEEPKKVLLRIYGQVHGERAMDAIITESVIFTLLSERKLGPKLHGVFSGGRIEQYIPARPLLTRELSEPAMSMKIAEKMAAIHSMDLPLIKEPNWLWKTLGRWHKTVLERLETAKPKDENEERCIKKLKSLDLEKEIEWLKNYLSSIDSPVVFCHNDMQEGNILLREDPPLQTLEEEERSDVAFDDSTNDSLAVHSDKENNHTSGGGRRTNGASYVSAVRVQFAEEDGNTMDSLASHLSDDGEPRLVLIDFEYCSYNHRGFDIANHFVEWMYNYTIPEFPFYDLRPEHYPTLEQKEIFMRQYLKHFNILHHSGETEFPAPPTVDEVNALNAEVEAFTLASHMLWTLWGAVNAGKSQIEFGYWDYSVSRAEWYFKVKQEIIKKENSGLPMKRKICEVDI